MSKTQFVAAALALVLVPQAAWSLDLAPIKDNTIFQDNQSNSAGAGLGIFAGNNNNKSPRHGLIQFDVAGSLPAGVIITGATLTLTVAQAPSTNAYSIDLRPLSADWGEGTKSAGSLNGTGQAAAAGDATWTASMYGSTIWTSAGGDYGPTSATMSVSGAVGQVFTWSSPQLLADVVGWYQNPSSNHGWALVNQSEGVNDQQTVKAFHSREATTASNRPVLSISFVPEPTSVAIAVLAGPVVLLYRRRKS